MNMSYTQNLEIYKQDIQRPNKMFTFMYDYGEFFFNSNTSSGLSRQSKRRNILKFATINFRHLLCLVQGNGFKMLIA